MKTISVVSLKGGAGKTTVAFNLALAGWSRGHRVLVADADPQGSCLAALKVRERPGPEFVAATAGRLFQIQQGAARDGVDILVIDTPARADAGLAEAIRLADLCLAVARPTFLDLIVVTQTIDAVRRLRRDGLVVLNQAPSRRGGMDPAIVVKARLALEHTGFDVAGVVIRTRAAFQASLCLGVGAEEWRDPAAAEEIVALWSELASRLHLPPSAERH